MVPVLRMLARVAETDATLLLTGETGTGKGVTAREVHAASARRGRPFVTVDCGAIPATLFESELFGHARGAFTGADSARTGRIGEAHGGTLFLDEIGELPLELQPKLLRALETREIQPVGGAAPRRVDVRVIAATHRDLRAEVAAGRFREDLYYRLAVLELTMPTLSERLVDLPALVAAMARHLGADQEGLDFLAGERMRTRFAARRWPGNIRELRNEVERALLFRSQLPEEIAANSAACGPLTAAPIERLAEARAAAVAEFERDYLRTLLVRHQNRVTEAASAAGISRVQLYRLLRRHGLHAPRVRRGCGRTTPAT